MSRAAKIAVWSAAAVIAITVGVVVAFLVTVQSDWFKNRVRERIVSEVENATGGKAEIGRFDYDWHTLTATVAPFVLHGKESASEAPFFRAKQVLVGLKIVSLARRKFDVASLDVEQPQVHISVRPDGTTNVPVPRNAGGSTIAQVIDLAVGRIEVHHGYLDYNSERIPLDFTADKLAANMRYFPGPPRYAGEIASSELHLTTPGVRDARFETKLKIALQKTRLVVESASLREGGSTVAANGVVDDFASPRASFDVRAHILAGEVAHSFALPVARQGSLDFDGKVLATYRPPDYTLKGRLNGRELSYSTRQVVVKNVSLAANVNMSPKGLALSSAEIRALGGRFRGSIVLDEFKNLRASGEADRLSLKQLAAAQGAGNPQMNGTASGPLQIEARFDKRGLHDVTARGKLSVTPAPGGLPVGGEVAAEYSERTGRLVLGNSNLHIGTTQINVRGTLGETLDVHIVSHNLEDLISALPAVGQKAPVLPVKLTPGGTAEFDGSVSGPLANAQVAGTLSLAHFVAEKFPFENLRATITANKTTLHVQHFALAGNELQADGSGRLALVNWKPKANTPVSASITVRQAGLAQIVADEGYKYPVSGTLAATVEVGGTWSAPRVTSHVQARDVVAYGQPFSTASAQVSYAGDALTISDGRLQNGPSQVEFSGAYNHRDTDWKTGTARFAIDSGGFTLSHVNAIERLQQGVAGRVTLHAAGTAHIVNGVFDLDTLASQAEVRNAAYRGRSIGSIAVEANTSGSSLRVRGTADVHGTVVRGSGEWRLGGDYEGEGDITVPRTSLATLASFVPGAPNPLPFTGFADARVHIQGPLKDLDRMTAEITVPQFEMAAIAGMQPRGGARASDLVLRNSEPLVVDITTKGAVVRSARFAGTDTTLDAAGRVGFTGTSPWDLRVNGSINLAILQLFDANLIASGRSNLNAAIRGALDAPQLNGRLVLQKASLYLANVPGGVDNANGVILFDGNRATVQRLQAESGGGTIEFASGSFVGFGGGTILYHVQATAKHVRYRSEEGFSITSDASVNLTGTPESSLLSGAITIDRASFNPRTDVGSLLASTAKPVSTPTVPNAYVRGIQFDLRVQSGQTLEIQTALTRDIEAEVNLRVRGDVAHPVVLGAISINQGEIDFFGNRYTINRAEVNFFNPARIEPTIDMDLETHVRAITVDITFTGPLNKLNFSYRSDPPLDSNQIIALLAVGREPVAIGGLASSQNISNQSFLATGTNALLEQAITAPVAGRLQRIFGVSHIKIDPQLTDITSVPQARLTLEQQISKDVTVTYITNLARTQEQILRLEWDLTRRWSVVAIRDENGLFGVDFQYRKRFK